MIETAVAVSSRPTLRTNLHRFIASKFHHPDLEALDVIFAACRAHWFNGTKKIWLWVIGVSGSGKTDIGMRCLESLPLTIMIGELSTKALISAKKGNPGLLFRLQKPQGRYSGILYSKDFTNFLSMHKDDRAIISSQFRDIADGRCTKDTGERNQMIWTGDASFIAACTPSIEAHWILNRACGDRTIQIRWRDSDDEASANLAQLHAGHEDEIAATIRSLALKYFGDPTFGPPPPIPSFMGPMLTQISMLSCWLRQPVHRNEFTGKIDDVGPREKPMRISKSIQTILAANSILQEKDVTEADLRLAYRISTDSVLSRRFAIVDAMPDDTELSFGEIQQGSNVPRSTLQRELDNLEEINIVTCSKRMDENNNPKNIYVLSERFSQLRATVLGLVYPEGGGVPRQ